MITSAISSRKKERPCLFIIRRSCIIVSINKTHCVSVTVTASLDSHIQVCHFNNPQSPAVNVYNHTWPTTEEAFFFHIFSLLRQTPQLSFTSEQRQQTTVQPPGHRWTGTNHQSEWLLMELEQLPQTIKKGQKDINSDVLKGGVGGGAADARVFISTKLKNKMSLPLLNCAKRIRSIVTQPDNHQLNHPSCSSSTKQHTKQQKSVGFC